MQSLRKARQRMKETVEILSSNRRGKKQTCTRQMHCGHRKSLTANRSMNNVARMRSWMMSFCMRSKKDNFQFPPELAFE